MDDAKLLQAFRAIEHDVLTAAKRQQPAAEVERYLDQLDDFPNDDEGIFQVLVKVVFYSGFKAETVVAKTAVLQEYFPDIATSSGHTEKDIERILADPRMIRNARKVVACVENAKQFQKIAGDHGSVANYIANFKADTSFENLFLLKEELEDRLDFVGGVTVYHLMTDLGLPVLKPDRVICRLLQRLGVLQSETRHFTAILIGRRIATLLQQERPPDTRRRSVRYVDRILVAHGQTATTAHAFGSGVCTDKPDCQACSAREWCKFPSRSSLLRSSR
jgi:DNA-3-methyladenine glycosylase I